MRRMMAAWLTAWLTGFAASTGSCAAAPSLFTAAQAQAGQAAYGQYCSSCHGANLQGITGPALVGPVFAKASDHYTLGLVFGGLVDTTPAGAPDSLSHGEYTMIMAYILAKNGYPAGANILTFTGAKHSDMPFYAQEP